MNSIAVGAGDARVVETGSKWDVLSCKDGHGKTATRSANTCAVSVLPPTCGRRLSTRSGRQGRGRVSEGGRPDGKRGQRREGQKELEKGQNQHDLNEINTNTKVKLEEKQRQQREARAGMAVGEGGG